MLEDIFKQIRLQFIEADLHSLIFGIHIIVKKTVKNIRLAHNFDTDNVSSSMLCYLTITKTVAKN